MIETHPFGDFVPRNANHLMLGSFTTKEAYDPKKKATYVWFYANGGRNQFWPIMESVYGTRLRTRKEMMSLFSKLGIALADIIISCERKKHSNLDMHPTDLVYTPGVGKILAKDKIEKIFFTSRFVEKLFRREFRQVIKQHPEIEQLAALPHPSPRYVKLSKDEKIKAYRKLLPRK